MNVTFFNTFNAYYLLYTCSVLFTQLWQHSYTNIHLNFTLYYYIYCILYAFTLHENISGSASIFASTEEFLALYPYVKIRFGSLSYDKKNVHECMKNR